MSNQHGGSRPGAGRPHTGRTTKVVRIPADMDMEIAIYLFYDLLPYLQELKATKKDSPRYHHLNKLLDVILYI